MAKDGAKLMLQVMSLYYETCDIMITTNLEFSKWVDISYDLSTTAIC